MDMQQNVLEFLNYENISFAVIEHEPVYTMEDVERIGFNKEEGLCKNLFLCDGKGENFFLLTIDKDTRIPLKTLGEMLGVKRICFASAKQLEEKLGITAGCVSPFALLNDTDHRVMLLLDRRLKEKKRLGVHPNRNDATIWISFTDLLLAMKKIGNPIKILEIE